MNQGCTTCGASGPWRHDHADWCEGVTKALTPLHPSCDVDGCLEPHHAKGWCSKHYQANRRAA